MTEDGLVRIARTGHQMVEELLEDQGLGAYIQEGAYIQFTTRNLP